MKIVLTYFAILTLAILATASPAAIDWSFLYARSTSDKLVYISSGEINRIDSDGTNPTNLTNNPANDLSPVYSPTLGKFVFVSNRTGTNQIFVMNADGTAQTNLSNSPMTDDTSPDWSPDGTKIVFVRDGSPDFMYDGIWTMNADGSNQVRIYFLSGNCHPVYSPDGSRIAFREFTNLLTIQPDGQNIASLASGVDLDSRILWSPDGNEVLFVKSGKLVFRQIYKVTADGSTETPLTNTASDSITPRWSPDGSRITFARLVAPNSYRIYTMNADGSNETEVLASASSAHTYNFPEWAPDGSRIGFTGNYEIGGQNFTGLGKTNADGTNPAFLSAADVDKPILWIDPSAAPTVRFTAASSTVNETDASAQITVSRSGDLSGATTVDYSTADGTATAGADYIATSGTLNFAAGEMTKTFNVSIINDTLIEADETVLLSLSNITNGAPGAPSNVVLTIISDESEFELAPESLNQSYSESSTGATFKILRRGNLSQPAAVTFSTADGTAFAGDDYTATSGTATFSPNTTEVIFTVALTPDNVPESDEFFTVTLSNPTSGTLGTNFSTQVNILEDDFVYTLDNSIYEVQESAGMVPVKIRRNATNQVTSVSYRTIDSTATHPSDYTETTGTLNFPVGVSELTINIPIIYNPLPEPFETFNFEIFSPSPGVLGTPNRGLIRLVDQFTTHRIENLRYSVDESAGVLAVKVVRNIGNTASTVSYRTVNGSATAPGDYAETTGTLNFGAGVLEATVNIPIVNDQSFEFKEYFYFEILGATGGTIGNLHTAAIAINGAASAQKAVLTTAGTSNQAVVFSDASILPSPNQTLTTGLLPNSVPHGLSIFGNNNALVSDFNNGRVYVVRISDSSITSVINTSAAGYGGQGTIAIAPDSSFALAMGGSNQLIKIQAPFNSSSPITSIVLPAGIATYQTQAIVFDNAGRAFVYHTEGISVLDAPYTSVTFTIPAYNPTSQGIAITPDGNTLMVTGGLNSTVQIYSAPFSASSTPQNLTVAAGGQGMAGILVTPDGTRAIVVCFNARYAAAISAPFTSGSRVESIPLPPAFSSEGEFTGFEDVGISVDSQTAIITGGSSASPPVFIRAPFGASSETFAVPISQSNSSRGAGAVRFLPPSFAPTAAGVSISGRVVDPTARGIAQVVVTLSGPDGVTRSALTNPLGFYQFDDVAVGTTYNIAVRHKRYVFEPNTRTLNVVDELTNVDFSAQ